MKNPIPRMTPAELNRIMAARYGSRQWKSAFCREFALHRKTVQRWTHKAYIKGLMAVALRNLPPKAEA